MGREAVQELSRNPIVNSNEAPIFVFVGLQPLALVDQVARVDWSLLDSIPGERGGSQRVTPQELEHILTEVNLHTLPLNGEVAAFRSLAGGSVANTIRGLAGAFHVPCAMVGARGDDEQGQMFDENMRSSGVRLDYMRVKNGPTGQCICLVDANGNRTMRPCLSDAVRFQANELTPRDFKGAKWIILNGYGFYGEELLERAVDLAKSEGAQVAMDLSSFEVIRSFRARLMKLLESRKIDLCFANEDEARELMRGTTHKSDPEQGLLFLSQYCSWAVVMLGPKGCIARHGNEVAANTIFRPNCKLFLRMFLMNNGEYEPAQVVRVSAVDAKEVVDTTGAGDLFASGFLFGMVNQLSLEDCCKIGCCSGAAVVQALGGEITKENLKWMQQQLDSRNLPSQWLSSPFSNKKLPIIQSEMAVCPVISG